MNIAAVVKVVEKWVKPVLSVGVPLAISWWENKVLDEKITKKASEVVAEALKKES